MPNVDTPQVGQPVPEVEFYEDGGGRVALKGLHRDSPVLLYAMRAFT